MSDFAEMNIKVIMEENPFENGEMFLDTPGGTDHGFSDGFSDGTDAFSDNPFETEASAVDQLPIQRETPTDGQQENACPKDADTKADAEQKEPDSDVGIPHMEEESEDKKRAEHEAAEAKRKEEWEAKQKAKKDEEKAQMERVMAMSDEELVSESMKRIGTDTEKLTRRNMKECVSEYIQTMCLEDAGFARQVMFPKKNMIRCFQYINRKAYEYVQDEIKAAGMQPGRDMPCYSSDIPDDLCYHWAEEYFRTMDVKEDEEKKEEFVPKPYIGKTTAGSKGKKTTTKKPPVKKPDTKKAESKKPVDDGQISFAEQLSLESIMASEKRAG